MTGRRAHSRTPAPKRLPKALANALSQYRNHLEHTPLSANTRRAYSSRAANYLYWISNTPAPTAAAWHTPAAVRAYRGSLDAAGRTPWTVNANLAAVEDLIRMHRGRETQSSRHPTPRTHTRILTSAEQAALAAVLPDLVPRDLLLILLLWDLAATPAVISQLRAADIAADFDHERFVLRIGKEAILVPPRLSAALGQYLPRRSTYGQARFLLAVGRQDLAPGGHLNERTVTDAVPAIGERAGIDDLSPRTLRRTALASILTNPDADLQAFGLAARVHPKHARQIQRNISNQIDKSGRDTLAALADQPDSSTPHIPKIILSAFDTFWRDILDRALPQYGTEVAAAFGQDRELQQLNLIMLNTLAGELRSDHAIRPAGAWVHDHLEPYCRSNRDHLSRIYRRHLLANSLLMLPASLAALLLTRGERPSASGIALSGLFSTRVRATVNDLVAINNNPRGGSQAWQLRTAGARS